MIITMKHSYAIGLDRDELETFVNVLERTQRHDTELQNRPMITLIDEMLRQAKTYI